jgi:hypothetical protein
METDDDVTGKAAVSFLPPKCENHTVTSLEHPQKTSTSQISGSGEAKPP